ncbi:MAG: BolA family protein [Bdellovibrionota bacterium]
METTINSKLTERFQPTHLEVVNESHTHSVPKNSETHFKIVVVSSIFAGLSRIARQRLVNDTLKVELAGGVHALTQKTLTPDEWNANGSGNFVSPDCHGGSKAK